MLAKLSFRSKFYWTLLVLLLMVAVSFVYLERWETAAQLTSGIYNPQAIPYSFIWKAITITIGVLAMIVLFFMWIAIPHSAIQDALFWSSPIEQHLCPDALELCQAHPEFTAFQRKVAAQGRQLTNGEFKCMQEACKEHTAEQLVQKELMAREALRAPLVFTAPAGC